MRKLKKASEELCRDNIVGSKQAYVYIGNSSCNCICVHRDEAINLTACAHAYGIYTCRALFNYMNGLSTDLRLTTELYVTC